MSFLKHLFQNWLGGMSSKHGNYGYGKHGGSGGRHGGYNPPQYTSSNTVNACQKCNYQNLAGARFCQQCGSSLVPANCANCGQPQTTGSKFCGQCGKAQ